MGAAGHRRSKPTERLAERVAAFGDLLPERGERRFRCLGKVADEPTLRRRPATGFWVVVAALAGVAGSYPKPSRSKSAA